MIKRQRCALNDDMDFFEEQLNASDGLIIGGVDYGGAPLGVFKTVGDRLHGLTSWMQRTEEKRKLRRRPLL